MTKITIPPVAGGFDLKTTVDARLQQVEDELNTKVLYKTNPVGEDNSLDNDIDMDGYDLLNAGTVNADNIVVDGIEYLPVLEALTEEAVAAAISASESATAGGSTLLVYNYQSIRDYAGAEQTFYARGKTTAGDIGSNFFQRFTGAAIGFYVDNDVDVLVPTGGDGSEAWLLENKKNREVDTVTLMKGLKGLVAGVNTAETVEYATGKGLSGSYDLITGTGTANNLDIIAHDTESLSWVLRDTGVVNIKQLGDVEGGVVDATAAFQRAALAYDTIVVPKGVYLLTGKVDIRAGQVWIMENPKFTMDGVSFVTLFEADDIDDWAILGRCEATGSLVTGADTGTEKGLVVKGCSRYRVEGFTAANMRSHGIHVMAGTLAPAPRGDQGQWTDCAAHECRDGLEIDPDTTVEFNVFSNFNAAGNLNGVTVAAGNCLFMGGNIVDNSLGGVTLIAGSNHAHGSFIGTQINHNAAYNINAVSVTNGHTFSGCHIYGNGGITAPIWFQNSKGIQVIGGIVDCAIYNDGTVGQNSILNNYLPGVDAALLGTDPEFMRVLGNWTNDGAWDSNDAASDYTLASRESSTQAIDAGTQLIFNNAIKDKRSAMNLSTGEFTAPITATYNIECEMTITGTFTANEYMEVLVNTVFRKYIPVIKIAANVGSAVISTSLNLAAGDNVTIRSQINAGISPLLATGSQIRLLVEQ